MTRFNTKRLTLIAIFIGISLVMFMIESLFPPMFIPGAKMGISNVVSMYAMVVLCPLDAIIIVTLKAIIGSMFFGSLSTLMYSLTAGLVAVSVACLLYKLLGGNVSLVAISVTSAVTHNLVQNLVFCLVTDTMEMLAYLPYLALLGIIAGLVVGFTVVLLIKRVPINIGSNWS